MPRISVRNAEIKINEKGQKFLFVTAYKMPKYVLSLLVKPKLKIFCLFCATDCPVLEVKVKINV